MSNKRITTTDLYISAKFKEARLNHNLTLEKVGEILGVSFQQIQKYEKGKNRIPAAHLYTFCMLINVSIYYFFPPRKS